MQAHTNQESSPQPLPDHVQERIWAFVRQQVRQHENNSAGSKVAKYEIHFTDAGRIEVEVLAMQDEKNAALAAGMEDPSFEYAAREGDVNRTIQRENLGDELNGNLAKAGRS
jgi:hypothetical protein